MTRKLLLFIWRLALCIVRGVGRNASIRSSSLPVPTSLVAEGLFVRKQLAFYKERNSKPQRPCDGTATRPGIENGRAALQQLATTMTNEVFLIHLATRAVVARLNVPALRDNRNRLGVISPDIGLPKQRFSLPWLLPSRMADIFCINTIRSAVWKSKVKESEKLTNPCRRNHTIYGAVPRAVAVH